ncbi:hypothetical protein [Herbiconiux daphne]|uniref:Uncharacterized protein n=1 Tax=Herbiconiux daphne TaxID=2970914 RepID=A0ABT2GX46_9MICO|nr:hypothetical protein [Herbiconiux daphne]MCS5732478.1 hypothetical protein [Herbiconiux daphne]
MTTVVRINQQSYVMDDTVVADTESRILDAVHLGGAFVGIDSSGALARVLVTPATAVSIETAEPIVVGTATDEPPELAFFDFDS